MTHPVLLDLFLSDAIEVDVDAVCDGQDVVIGGVMEHIELAGVHSGDSSCSLPAFNLTDEIQHKIRTQSRDLAYALNVVGLVNVQFAIKGNDIYVLEVNPRASRNSTIRIEGDICSTGQSGSTVYGSDRL